MQIEFREEPARRLAGVEHVGPYWQIGSAFDRLGEWVKTTSLPRGVMVGVYWDDPRELPEAELRSAACIEIPEDAEVSGPGVSVIELPAGEFAWARFTGAYSGLPAAWGELIGGIFAAGREPASGAGFEVYVNNCDDVAGDETRLVTDLYQPVAPK